MVALLRVLAFLAFAGGVVLITLRVLASKPQRRYGEEPVVIKKPLGWGWSIALACTGLFLFLVFVTGGATQVGLTDVAVVENTMTGQFAVLNPGTHIWPFSRSLTPVVTKITKYSLRRQIVEIGAGPVSEKGVQADSNSPGRPVVFYWARGWAYPNKAAVIQLHRMYGPDYLDNWVERNWVSTLKAVQGAKPYDYVGNNRVEMQDAVERELQLQLLGEDGETPLVFVSQLSIVEFDFDGNVNGFLEGVQKKEFARQEAEQQILINQKEQEAKKIQAETDYITTKRAAEAEQAKRIAEAEGLALAQERVADAEAYTTKVTYQAQADGIVQLQQALGRSPEYLTYQQQEMWGQGGAKVPSTLIVGLDGYTPFLNLLPSGEAVK